MKFIITSFVSTHMKRNEKHTYLCSNIHNTCAHLYHTFHKFQDISQQQHHRAFDWFLNPTNTFTHSLFSKYTNNLLITELNNLQ